MKDEQPLVLFSWMKQNLASLSFDQCDYEIEDGEPSIKAENPNIFRSIEKIYEILFRYKGTSLVPMFIVVSK